MENLTMDDFRLMQQLIIPFIAGSIGGFITVLLKCIKKESELDDYSRTYRKVNKDSFSSVPLRLYWKYSFVGGVAGFAAVALLNPQGTTSQVSVLALLAGLSGIQYLKQNALVTESERDTISAEREKLSGLSTKDNTYIQEDFADLMGIDEKEPIEEQIFEDPHTQPPSSSEYTITVGNIKVKPMWYIKAKRVKGMTLFRKVHFKQ